MPGALIARPDYAKENPDAVAKYLAVYLRAWAWIGAHPKEARAMMKKFYSQGGVEISDAGIESEFADRPVFGLDAQVKIMDRSKGKSDVDTWLGNIGEFMKSVGTIPEVPDAKGFIDDSFMKRSRPILRSRQWRPRRTDQPEVVRNGAGLLKVRLPRSVPGFRFVRQFGQAARSSA